MNQKIQDNQIVKIAIKVDPQMKQEVEEYMAWKGIKTFEEAVFEIFQDGRLFFRDLKDEAGE